MVLWIDKNTFASSLLEKVFKKAGLPFYTVSSVEDFGYLVEDLAPDVIVLDGETFASSPDKFLEQYYSSPRMQETPFVFLSPVKGMNFCQKVIGEINRPFDPFKVPQILKNFIAAN